MSMWCAPDLLVGVFIFKAYFFKKFIFAACLPKHSFAKTLRGRPSRIVSPYCDLKADF